jgi:outer membrane protein assembly factor BamE
MTQQQVAYALGTNDVRSVRHQHLVLCIPSAAWPEDVTQQTLTLTFNSSGVLTNIDNKPALTK